MLKFPQWRVDVTVDGNIVKTFYETATTAAAAIGKAKHKMRGAVSSAEAFRFKAAREDEPASRHATKKTPAQLQREIDEVLASPGKTRPAPSHATMAQGAQFIPFATWGDVLDAARRGEDLWYRAPLDRQPASVRVVKVFKNGGIRIDPMSRDADNFTADEGHLDRFRKRA